MDPLELVPPPRWVVRSAAAVAILIGLVWLGAWLLGAAPRWPTVGVGAVETSMAAALALAGAALVLLEFAGPRGWRLAARAAAGAIAALVILLGLVTLTEHAFGHHLPVDQLIAVVPPGTAGEGGSNRIGVPGSTGLALVGGGLLAFGCGRRRLALGLGLAACGVSLVPAVGLLYGADELSGGAGLTAIGWPCVLGLAALSAGLVLAYEGSGRETLLRRRDAGGVQLRRLILPAILVPLVLGYLSVLGEEHGLYDPEMGNRLLVVAAVLVQSAFVWWSASSLSRAERRSQRDADSLRRAELLAEHSRDVFLLIRRDDGRILEANAAASAAYGYSREELLFLTLGDLRAPETLGALPSQIAEADAHGILLETVHRRKDGSMFPVEVSSKGATVGATRFLVSVVRDLSERKRAQEQLAFQAGLLSRVHDAVVATDENQRITYLNDVAQRTFGWTEQEALGRPSAEVLQVETGGSRRPRLASLVRAGCYEGELRYRRKDGTSFAAEVRTGILRGPDGAMNGLVTSVRDETERKWAEEQLAFHADLLAQVHDALAATDEKLRVTYWNDAAEEIYGWSSDEAIGRPVAELLRSEVVGPSPADDLEMLLRVGHHERELRQRRKDGTLIDVDARVTVLKGPKGEMKGVLSSIRDITERKRAQAELAQAKDTLESTLSSIADGFFALDAEWRFAAANRRAVAYFGRPVSALLGQNVWAITSTPPDSPTRQRFEEARRTGRPVHFEMQSRLRPELWADVHLYMQGDVLAAYFSDISERKRSETALRENEAALRDADRRKNEFLAVLSHELRNPLAPISNSLYVLDKAAPGSDEMRRAQAVIGRQVRQLTRLVDDLLDVTRISRNKIQLQRERLEFNDLVRRTVEDHRSLFEQSGVALQLETSPAPIFVQGDWNRLAQVVGNLLQNAAKFSGRGGVTNVTVRRDAQRTRALVRVSDTGVGMAPEMLTRAFEPFMQAETTLDRSKGGLGLGLALVKGLVELHGGEIKARSEGLGKGAEFDVRLPVAPARAVETAQTRVSAPAVGRRVLVIEDNVDAANSLRDVLLVSQHEVEVAYTGPEGLAKARSFHPDVVLCDIGLPEMDGYAVARAFRADPQLRGTFLVALTGYALPEDVQRAVESGFERHLVKPPSVETIQQLLGAAGARPPGDPGRGADPPPASASVDPEPSPGSRPAKEI